MYSSSICIYCFKDKHDKYLPKTSNMKASDIYLLTQVLSRSILPYRSSTKIKPKANKKLSRNYQAYEYLQIKSSINLIDIYLYTQQ